MAGTSPTTRAPAPSAARTWLTSAVTLTVGAFTSTATLLTSPSLAPSAWLTTPSTPDTPSSAVPPSVTCARTAAATGYLPPTARRACLAAAAVVTSWPPAKADHIRWLAAVAGGVHGRSAARGRGEHGEPHAVDRRSARRRRAAPPGRRRAS